MKSAATKYRAILTHPAGGWLTKKKKKIRANDSDGGPDGSDILAWTAAGDTELA